jgi:hypothetical protein
MNGDAVVSAKTDADTASTEKMQNAVGRQQDRRFFPEVAFDPV